MSRLPAGRRRARTPPRAPQPAYVVRRRPSRSDAPVSPKRLLALFAAPDCEAFIDAAFDALRAAVSCDVAVAFYRNDGDGLMKARDSRQYPYDAQLMHRYLELTPAIPIALATPGIRVITTRVALPESRDELEASAFYREIMQPLGWRHSVALCFWSTQPANLPVIVTSVERREGRRDFSSRDVAILERIHPYLEAAVNRVYERDASNLLTSGLGLADRSGRAEFAVLDRSLRVIQASPGARRRFAAWLPGGSGSGSGGPPGSWRLPPEIADACRVLQKEWQAIRRVDTDTIAVPRKRSVASLRRPELTAWITTVAPNTPGLAEPMFLVDLHKRFAGTGRASPSKTAPLLQALTGAERAVALVLADGLSNQEIADHLGKSVHAVKFLLHRIYERTGVPNRAALVAALRSGGRRLRKPPPA